MQFIEITLSKIGTLPLVVFAAAALVAWWILHWINQRRVDAIYAQMKTLDDETRAGLFEKMPERLRDDIEKRIRDEKKS